MGLMIPKEMKNNLHYVDTGIRSTAATRHFHLNLTLEAPYSIKIHILLSKKVLKIINVASDSL